MTDIQIFSNPQFGEIRTLADEANEPLFCAADVCKALGYANPAMLFLATLTKGM